MSVGWIGGGGIAVMGHCPGGEGWGGEEGLHCLALLPTVI